MAVAALKSGLHAAQRDDYPVTVKSGHSLAQLVLSPRRIEYAGTDHPDAFVVITDDGYRKIAGRLGRLPAGCRLFTLPEFAEATTPAQVEVFDPSALPARVGKGDRALVMVSAALHRLGVLPWEALQAAAGEGPFAEGNLAAVEQGRQLAALA